MNVTSDPGPSAESQAPEAGRSGVGPLPNFLICGAQKAGTTSLHHYLSQHPDCFMPGQKELNFFTLNYDQGIQWYADFFRSSAGEKAIGEASPQYMRHPEVPERIARTLGETKLIFILRNPVERAYSNYHFNIARGLQNPRQSFRSAIRCAYGIENYLQKGLYFQQIERFLHCHSRDNMLFLVTERMSRRPGAAMRRCCGFLGIFPEFSPKLNKRNVTLRPIGEAITAYYRLWMPLKRAVIDLVPAALRSRTQALRDRLHRLAFSGRRLPSMSEQTRRYLHEYYRSANDELSKRIGVDLSEWDLAAGQR